MSGARRSGPGRWGLVAFAGAWVAAAGTGMYLSVPGRGELADMLGYSLILPILYTSFTLGRRGGLFTALAASLACGAVILGRGEALSSPWVRQLLYQVAVFNVVALVTSGLSERLREARNRYRELFAGSPAGMYRLDTGGRIMEVNRAAADMLRAGSPRELLGLDARDLFVDAADVRRWMDAVRGGGDIEVETRMRRLDGSVIWVRDRNRAVTDADGRVRCFEGSVEDITRRRQGRAVSAILHDITDAVAQTRDLSELYRSIHEVLERHVAAANFSIALAGPDGGLEYVYFKDEHVFLGLDRDQDDNGVDGAPRVCTPCREVVRTGRPLLLDRRALEGVMGAGEWPAKPPRVWLGIPLKVKDAVMGCMVARGYGDQDGYEDRDVDLMVAVSERVALAIERKMDADALAAGEEKYRSLFENAMEGVFQCSMDGRFLSVNPAMARILGYAEVGELVDGDKGFRDFIVEPGHREADIAALLEGGGRVRGLELRMARRDGRAMEVSMNLSAVTVKGRPPHLEGWVQDVTERNRARDELARANALHQDIIDFLPDATVVVDAKRRIIAWNKAMEEMTGVAKADVLGRVGLAVGEVFYGEPRPVLMDLLFEEHQGLAGSYDFVERRDDCLVAETWVSGFDGGRGMHVWAAAAPLYDAEGRMAGAIESVRDVTKRKLAEDALRRAHAEMERRVDERTRELQQANLRLRELDEMKSEFLSSASHELRTPLTSVLGFVKLIHKSFDRYFSPLAQADEVLRHQAARILDNLDIIAHEGRRLTRLINNLLDLNKIESGRMDWRDEPLDVGDLVRRAVQAVRGEFADLPEVRLTMEVAEDMPMVLADRDRVQQVVLNLLSNAAKFTRAGSVEVMASGGPERVRVEVRDTGPGIAPEETERIFGKFYQSESHTPRDKTRGTGLGLTICREIVEHYGGSITVDSTPGSGSVFTMELPARAS